MTDLITRRYMITGAYMQNQTQEGWDQLVYQMDQEVRRTNRYAVVEVNPDIHGTDETKGITLVRGLTHSEATAWKDGYLSALSMQIGCHVTDDFRVTNHGWDQDIGVLVCPEDRAPADPSDSEDTTNA
jgi:hypothetical protein